MPDVSVFPFSLAVVANQRFIEIPLLPRRTRYRSRDDVRSTGCG